MFLKRRAVLFVFFFSLWGAAMAQEKNVSRTLEEQLQGEDSIDVVLSFRKLPALARYPGRVMHVYPAGNMVVLRLARGRLRAILRTDSVLFADLRRRPTEELTTGAYDLSANRITTAHHLFPAYNGSSVNASVKEQKPDTADIDLRGRFFNSGVAATTTSSHATFMATMMAGAGNSSPFAKGAAPGSRVTSSSFVSLLPDGDEVYRTHSISVQNHSYGTEIENYYGNEAAAYDGSVWRNPSLVHVFSAGNRGTATSASGLYAGIDSFANLTGNFKMAKNVISVGHIDSTYHVLPPSSKGPAHDGRLKPELVAYGEDGSSGAAALVSGTALLVQDAYKKRNGMLPPASLVKAILLNAAQDIHTPGPDFTSGYGNLDALAALRTVAGGTHLHDTLASSGTRSYTLPVPASARRLQVTLVWTDPAALPNATKALVHDLDVRVAGPSAGGTWLPWVLSGVANKDSLIQPAVRGRDTVNNAEQLSISNPQAGNYTIEVRASGLTAAQPFSIAYTIDTATGVSWLYPTGSDVLLAGEQNIIRWAAPARGTAALSYTLDGRSWESIATVALDSGYYKWNAPDSVSTAQVRIDPPGNAPVVSDTFVLSRVTEVAVGYHCPDSVLLLWNGSGVNEYVLYGMEQNYLQPLRVKNDSSHIVLKQNSTIREYSVAPLIGNKPGLRSFTVDYNSSGVGCFIRSFYASLTSDRVVLTLALGTVSGIREVRFHKWNGTAFATLPAPFPPVALSMEYTDRALLKGANRYRVEIVLLNGSSVFSETIAVSFLGSAPILVYPNPARQTEGIKILAQTAGVYTLEVMDAAGKVVFRQPLNTLGVYNLPVQLAPGMYFFVVRDKEGRVSTQKLTVL